MARPVVTNILCMFSGQVVILITYTGHGWGTSACAHPHTPVMYLDYTWTDFAEIWCVARRDPLATRFAHAIGGANLHEHTCALPFFVSQKRLDALR